nr:RNA-directed DNA polymerase, eukaryota [Tanacetum cinerariifolium]
MNSFRSKEDHVIRISKSVFVTNFLDSFRSRDLWSLCEEYGKVVDVFIPNRKSKAGKRFAFVRFIRVDDMDWLIDNLCTLWDVSRQVMGRTKDVNSIPNLRTILTNEGFMDFNLSYLGGLWVMIELNSEETKMKLLQHTGVNSWFKELKPASQEIGMKWGTVMDIEESPGSSFAQYKDPGYLSEDESSLDGNNNLENSQQGNVNQVEESDADEVSDTIFEVSPQARRVDVHKVNEKANSHHSDDPFGLYDLLRKSTNLSASKEDPSLSHPLRFTLVASHKDPIRSNSAHLEVGRSKGYDMEGCSKDIEQIISSIGNSDGILCVWEETIFNKVDVSIALYGIWLPTNSKILIVVIYAPQSFGLKRILLDYISGLITRWNGETIVLGDFNEVRSEDERFGSIFHQSYAREFNHFISSSSLLEVKMEGYSFTWSHSSASKMSKLDRFLVSEGIFVTFPTILAICLDRHLFDHRLILLNEIHTDYGPTHFRVYHSWFKQDGFDALIKESNASQVGAKKVILDDLVIIDMNLDKETFPIAMVKEAFLDHFTTCFKQPLCGRLKLNMSFPNRLSSDQVGDLDKDISIDEIRKAMWDCGVSKSPAPDSFTFELFRRYWHFIGPDFCAVVNCFFDKGRFPRGSNSSFIALIPKVMDAKFVTDFRPISLIGSVYKVVTKILANRLTTVISVLISNTQSAFVANRHILDGPFILNEVLAWCKRRMKQALVFKVDFAKAYDSVRWDFLLDILLAFGFGPK